MPDYPNTLLFINGSWRQGGGGKPIAVSDPATGRTIGTVEHAGAQDLEDAVAAAQAGFRTWSRTAPLERSGILRKAAALIRERRDRIATLLTLEQGKPLAQAQAELDASAEMTEWLAEECRRTFGRVIPARDERVLQYTTMLPVGPVAAFTPWNFPVNQVVRKLAAALGAGCSIIVKAPEETPASPAALIQAFADAGVPSGVMNLVYGVPSEISRYLISHPVIRKISFTGSTAVGKELSALAGAHMKRTTMELGGHAPVMVFEDADLDHAVPHLLTTKFRNAGQVCASPTRFMVHRDIASDFTDRFVEGAKTIRVGNGLDPASAMGPLANPRRIPALQALIADAAARGGRILTGGERIGNTGEFFQPTVLADVPADARIMNEEPFGPVVIVNRIEGIDDAIAEANRLEYGLASYAFTGSQRVIHRLTREVEAGMTTINHAGLGFPEIPFGGIKDSGHGSEGGSAALEPYLNVKFTSVLT